MTGAERILVPLSLAASVLANDGEERATMARALPATIERAPRPVRERMRAVAARIDQRHVDAAIGAMSVLYAAAVIDGWRTAGRGRLFQDVQLVFGLHGFAHVLASVVTRGYTTGVATSPTVVLPQWWWARSRMRRARVAEACRLGRALAVVLGWLAVSHAVGAWAATRERTCGRRVVMRLAGRSTAGAAQPSG